MKAVILAGGYGTRLQPLTLRTPKGILPVANSTIIEMTLKELEKLKIEKAILSLNKNQIKVKEFLDEKYKGIKIEYVFEESKKDADKLGAIGALAFIIKKFGLDDYAILGSDNYIKGLDYEKMLAQHREKKSEATIALYELMDMSKVSNYGIAVMDKDKRITHFQEKPKAEEANSRLASTFNYFITKDFSKKILEYVSLMIKGKKKPDNVGDLWEYYLETSSIHGFEFSGEWGDLGKPLPYIEINRKALNAIRRDISREAEYGNNVKISGNVIISKGCKIKDNAIIIGPCFIDSNATIGENSIIGPYTSILHDTSIGNDNIISGSIIFEKIKTKSNVKITRALIDGGCEIQENNKIEEQAMIGYSCTIEKDSQIFYNTKLWPFLTIGKNSIINGAINYELDYIKFEPRIKNSKYWK
ncbi:MAG: NDP-sugar synthase [Candidatus Nanoarchaeia archaeon]|nr:NDP-sugar synthase [Candidatus Nanoarchaeia archaeon]